VWYPQGTLQKKSEQAWESSLALRIYLLAQAKTIEPRDLVSEKMTINLISQNNHF
jgi:hypothetical protein